MPLKTLVVCQSCGKLFRIYDGQGLPDHKGRDDTQCHGVGSPTVPAARPSRRLKVMPNTNDEIMETLRDTEKTIGEIMALIASKTKKNYMLLPVEMELVGILSQLAKAVRQEMEKP
jgi:hypothetical protein